MNIYPKVWPDFMDVFDFIIVNNFFHQYLNPCRYPYNYTDIPFTGVACNLIQFCIPVSALGNALAGLVKALKPEWKPCCLDTAEVAFKVTAAFVQVSASTEH